ncbi:MAG: polyhydroxyalkanoic acid system family protein [Planctomycetota bacterium]|nr:polyhydroxyalkanoic acid system family protein [Planctomycetota bacterium]
MSGMGSVRIRVEHALGRQEALSRIRRAADGLGAKGAAYVKSVEWSESGAVVAGDGFDGRFVVTDTDVTAEVELGWKLAFFPLKVQRDAEAWLRDLLR